MPLTAKKIAHIKSNLTKSNVGRRQSVVLTIRLANGTISTLTVNAIWRVMGDFDPVLQGPNNFLSHTGTTHDIFAAFEVADITLAQLRSTIYASLGADHTGVEPAIKYTLLDVQAAGIMPGGDRYYTRWTRAG